jgi:Fibronectin type III domain
MKTFARYLFILAGALLGVCSICTAQATSGVTIHNGNTTGPGGGILIIDLNSAPTGPDCSGNGGVQSMGYNIIGDNADAFIGSQSTGQIGTPGAPIDPRLGVLENNGGPTFTHGLLAGSPATDRDAPDAPPRDQRGYNRFGVPDVGAFEFGELPATIPSPPIARPATYIASNSFTANWSSVSGATGYRLDVSRNSSFSTYVAGYQNLNVGNTISRSVTGLNASTTYYYRVRAYNISGTSGNSNVVSVTTLSPTGPPVAITNPATLIASFSATLNGSVDPHGLNTTVYFQYGTTTSYGHTTLSQIKTGNTYQNVTANISGLTASTTYHFRLVATNSAGTRYGVDRTFTTLTPTGPPVVTTNLATFIASFSARLNGSVDPHGLPTTVYFQYGTTTSYGLTTAIQSKTGNTYQNVTANISGLTASTTYHFRIVATNSAGIRYGSDRTFTTLSATGPPVVITNQTTNIATNTATLNGTVDPHGLTTTVYFQYGTTISYGHTSASQSKTGNTYQNVSANISGLTALTTYHFRIVGTNNSGTTYGSDRTFTTHPY